MELRRKLFLWISDLWRRDYYRPICQFNGETIVYLINFWDKKLDP